MDIGTDLFRSFVAVAESLNFTRAAKSVHRTQSAVSQQIKRLERELGVVLFERKGPNVSLTPTGESFLPHARQVLKAHDQAVSAIVEPELCGSVQVGISNVIAAYYLPDILKKFASHHPCIQVGIRCESRAAMTEALEKGEINMFIDTSVNEITGARLLARTNLVWMSSERHGAHLERPVPLAMFLPSCSYRQYALETLERAGLEYRIAYSSASLAGVQGAVASGMAVTALIAPCKPEGVMVLGEPEGFPELPKAKIYVVQSNTKDPLSDCFAEIAAEIVRQGSA